MTGRFSDKIFVVTGSTQGLGEAIARRLAAEGAKGLVVTGRDAGRGEVVAASLRERGAEVAFVQAELAELDQVRSIVAAADSRWGRIDGLVNAAGITDRGTLLSTDPELFDRMMAINVRAPFFLMQDAVRVMLREKIGGIIVNILSMSGHGGQSFLTAYSASKTALGGLTKNIAFQLLPHRIRANGLNIGWMDTPGEHAIQKATHDAPDDWLTKAEAGRPFGRLLKPDEVARVVAFLSCEESGMMTGALIDMDQQVLGCADMAAGPQAPLA